ncbi:MAG: ABC transporter ATP-binding protein [Deltaproteobacteria bacterium]|nr:ABC transporter ATP-binding protein [Deltaproteobacteria bacterium]
MILSVNGIAFSYNSRSVIKNISFELKEGEIVGVLGTNGAGKSTLLKCLNNILRPNKGCISIENKNISKMRSALIAKKIGYVPQKYEKRHQSVFDAVLLGRKPYIKWSVGKKDFDIVEKILKTMKLDNLAFRLLHTLSGGEMQKVIIARALAQEPKILILDEPTSSLDIKNQIEVMKLLYKIIKKEKIAAVMAIHDLNLAFRFADKFLTIKNNTVYSFTSKEAVTAAIIKEVYDIKVKLARINEYTIVTPI